MKIDNQDIFEKIGALFYAIAAEQHVKPLEVAGLKLLVSEYWLPRNHEETRTVVPDETHYILVSMDTRQANETTASQAFREFASFYNLHPDVFTDEVKVRIMDTAKEITKVFKADNPFDNANLAALKTLFKSPAVKA